MKYRLACDCGYEFVFNSEARPGSTVWQQCDSCGDLFRATLPGERQGRATRATSQVIQDATFDVFYAEKPPLTVRRMFYALETQSFVPKTEGGYRKTQYQLATLRRAGILPYNWLADNTRWQIKPTSYTGLEAAMTRWHEQYRRDLWQAQSSHVEIWVEKDALAGVIAPITRQYDVPLFVARGYASMSFLYSAAEDIKAIGKPAFIYHFGDYDPSGVNAAYKIRDELQAHGAKISFERVAITEAQIAQYSLPTRPTKRKDPRAKRWGGQDSVELDALPANILRALVRECIERHIDRAALDATKQAESLERQSLEAVMNNFVLVQNRG